MFRTGLKKIILCATFFLSFSAVATETRLKPEFVWVPEAQQQSSFQTQVGGGLLDDKGITGHHGTPVYVLIRANYNIDERSSLFIDLPMAGTLSGGPDDFGIGNISVGGNHRLIQGDQGAFSFGLNATFPTSQNGSVIGRFTRSFTSFIKDQYAVSPYLIVNLDGDRFQLSLDAGLDEQIFTNRAAGQDRLDSVIFYDGGLSMAIDAPKDYFATLEFSGYSPLTYASNKTQLFGGPGIRYQDEEISYGLHLMAPFASPSRDQIDFLVLADVRFKF